MDKIRFEYPYFIFKKEKPEDSVIVQREAYIRPVNLSHEPYDAFLNDGKNSYHLIFGKQINGRFLCIPNFFIGCELSSYDDIPWNVSSLAEASGHCRHIGDNDVMAICYAVKVLKSYLK